MKKILYWKKALFKETYELFSNGLLAGILKESIWKHRAYGELNDTKLNFKTTGFFKQVTQIFDKNTNLIIGKISYNSWMTKATIEYNNEIAYWKYDNLWNTEWSISDSDGSTIEYQGSSSNGTIEYETQNDILILSGLFVSNLYLQITIIIFIIVFFTIFINFFLIF
jgi:hypothetical protein